MGGLHLETASRGRAGRARAGVDGVVQRPVREDRSREVRGWRLSTRPCPKNSRSPALQSAGAKGPAAASPAVPVMGATDARRDGPSDRPARDCHGARRTAGANASREIDAHPNRGAGWTVATQGACHLKRSACRSAGREGGANCKTRGAVGMATDTAGAGLGRPETRGGLLWATGSPEVAPEGPA